MKRKQLDDLTIYNSGSSRSRITLVTAGDQPVDPRQIAGSRWIVFGDAAAAALHTLILDNSYLVLDDLLPGGFSSSTWQDMHRAFELQPPEIGAHGDLEFLNFGRDNSRVLLLRCGSAFRPERVEGTNIITLSPRARQRYAAFLASLPGRVAYARDALAGIIPGGLSGSAINRSRRALRS